MSASKQKFQKGLTFDETSRLISHKQECSVIDLFCGVGGITHGFVLEGFNVIAGIDSDESCRYAYEQNNKAKFIHAKIEEMTAKKIAKLYPEGHLKILVGCAPCQPFSQYTKKRDKGDKWKLVSTFADRIIAIKPEIVSMENVPELVSFDQGKIFKSFVRRLKRVGYHVHTQIVDCLDYGVPQKRRRLVLLASRLGDIALIDKTHNPDNYKKVGDAIGDLPPIKSGEVCPTDPLHRARQLREINLQRIRQSKPGGTWRDWDEELVAECHRKATGKSYASVYGRMSWEEPAPTITTEFFNYGSGRFGHPDQDRPISLREGALLQTFPLEYQFVAPDGKYTFEHIGRHIGNAVPVELGRVIAKSIKRHIDEHYTRIQTLQNVNQPQCP